MDQNRQTLKIPHDQIQKVQILETPARKSNRPRRAACHQRTGAMSKNPRQACMKPRSDPAGVHAPQILRKRLKHGSWINQPIPFTEGIGRFRCAIR